MISIAVIGANGYVGRAICEALYNNNSDPDKKEIFAVFEVDRSNYETRLKERITNPPTPYHTIINCAMPSRRLWAENNPTSDYFETVEKTRKLVKEWSYNKFIQISSVSARCEDTVYGRHKLEAESICPQNSLIIRLSAMYHPTMSKGVLLDILNEKVYVSKESRYPFCSLSFVASWIAKNLDRSGVAEVGAKDTISVGEIAEYLSVKPEYSNKTELQEIMNPEESFPSANEVLRFMDEYAL